MFTRNLKRNKFENSINSENESNDKNEVIPSFRKKRLLNILSSETEEMDETEVQNGTPCDIIWTSNNFIPPWRK